MNTAHCILHTKGMSGRRGNIPPPILPTLTAKYLSFLQEYGDTSRQTKYMERHSEQYAVCSVQCSVRSVQYVVCSVQCELYSVQRSVSSV